MCQQTMKAMSQEASPFNEMTSSLSLFLHIRIAAVNAEESEEKATTATAHIAYAYTQTDYIDTCVHYGIVDILYSYVT